MRNAATTRAWTATMAAALGLTTLVGASGCANAGEGLLSGAALGAATGAVIGSFRGETVAGATMGAVTGALAGAVLGDQNERARENAAIAGQGGQRVVYIERDRRAVDPPPDEEFDWRAYERKHHQHHHHQYERCWLRDPPDLR